MEKPLLRRLPPSPSLWMLPSSSPHLALLAGGTCPRSPVCHLMLVPALPAALRPLCPRPGAPPQVRLSQSAGCPTAGTGTSRLSPRVSATDSSPSTLLGWPGLLPPSSSSRPKSSRPLPSVHRSPTCLLLAPPVKQRREAAQGAHRRFPHSRQQNSARRARCGSSGRPAAAAGLRASCEALYGEMDPEERLRPPLPATCGREDAPGPAACGGARTGRGAGARGQQAGPGGGGGRQGLPTRRAGTPPAPRQGPGQGAAPAGEPDRADTPKAERQGRGRRAGAGRATAAARRPAAPPGPGKQGAAGRKAPDSGGATGRAPRRRPRWP